MKEAANGGGLQCAHIITHITERPAITAAPARKYNVKTGTTRPPCSCCSFRVHWTIYLNGRPVST